MLLLTIAYEGDFDVAKDLQEFIEDFKHKNLGLGICESIENNTHFIKILCNDNSYDATIKNTVNFCVSNILYNIIIDVFYYKEMYEFLTDSYFFLRDDELKEIQHKIVEVLRENNHKIDESNIYFMNRKNDIIEKIKKCIEENQEINIEGFLTFRMKEIMEDLESISDKVVERYMVEKEYNEFIKLLKYFVDIQESKIEEVNIIILEDGSYSIKDKEGKDIFNEFLSEIMDYRVVNPSVNIEDVIISGLITNSPKKIIIHRDYNCTNKEILETIKNVFTDRVEMCDNCKMCNATKIKI